jgi:integrase
MSQVSKLTHKSGKSKLWPGFRRCKIRLTGEMISTSNSKNGRPSMVKVKLRGVAKVKAKGRVYYYAWRGGPRLRDEPGTPEFMASYNEAVENQRTPDTGKFNSVVTLYKASNDYKTLAESTRANWMPWLDRVAEYFGELRIAQFDRPDKIRPVIRRWRNQWSDRPRTADYGMQVLSRVLPRGWPVGKDREQSLWRHQTTLQQWSIWNHLDRLGYFGTQKDLLRRSGSRGRSCRPYRLAAERLTPAFWSHVGEDAITFSTGKSRGRREAIIPLYDDLLGVLARIPKRATRILTSSKQRPWTSDGFGSSFNKAKNDAGFADRDLHFHDLRGTAATKFYIAGLSIRVIAEILAWSEDQVERIIRRYVARAAATKEAIRQLNEARKRT